MSIIFPIQRASGPCGKNGCDSPVVLFTSPSTLYPGLSVKVGIGWDGIGSYERVYLVIDCTVIISTKYINFPLKF